VDAVATTDETGTTVFVVNRDLLSAVTVTVDLRSAGASTLAQALYLHDGDLAATNTREAPDRVTLRPLADASLHDGLLTMTLPPVSWAAATCRPGASQLAADT
jgi:alpha-N-arabinofuranosidase